MSKESKRLFWLFPKMFLLELGLHNLTEATNHKLSTWNP